jgi:hypothetical protein
MIKHRAAAFLCLSAFLFFAATTLPQANQDGTVLFREKFANLDNWKPLVFPGIQRQSIYSTEYLNGIHYLKAQSNASASAIVYKHAFNVYEYPRVRWRWKVSNLYAKGDFRTKEGDDYPIRIYIMFAYDPKTAGPFQKMTYGLAKKLYGKYPPDSTLNYVWANTEQPEGIVTSPYTERARMIALQKGGNKVGSWQDEEINILADYRKAFGTDPPATASIAIMNDSDNTGEISVSFVEYIEIFK